MTTPGELKTYFRNLATAIGCASFEYGSTERILNRQSSNLNYPVLWLEVPDLKLFRSGGLKKRMITAFAILSNVNPDDYQEQDDTHDECWNMTVAALQKMQEDSDDGVFEFDMGDTFSQKKEWWSADNDWGWRTEIEIVVSQCEHTNCPACAPPTATYFFEMEDGSGFFELEDDSGLFLSEAA